MLCNNPLKQLTELLNGKETKENLIDRCETSDSVRDFANEIAGRACQGDYNIPTKSVNSLDAYDAAVKFAAWWQYK